MAITNFAGISAGLRPPVACRKVATGSASVGNGLHMWYNSAYPVASTAPSPGINGEAVSTALSGSVIRGMFPRTNPPGGVSSYLANFSSSRNTTSLSVNGNGMWLIVDRLWHNSGLSSTSTSLQSITPVAMAPRDMNASSNGLGVMMALEISSTMGSGTPTVTATYTNSAGTSGRTSTITATNAAGIGGWQLFPLADGDVGVRSVEGLQMSATRSSGTMHLVLFRVVALVPQDHPYYSSASDALTLSLPRIHDSSVLSAVYFTGFAGTGSQSYSYMETHG